MYRKVRFVEDYSGRHVKHREFAKGDFGVFLNEVCDVLIRIGVAREPVPEDAAEETVTQPLIEEEPQEAPEPEETEPEEAPEINASRAAKRYAIQNGIDLTTVTGTGKGGLITVKDVKAV